MAQPQLDDAAVPGQTRNNGSCWPCSSWPYSYLGSDFSKHRTCVHPRFIGSLCKKEIGDHVTKP